MSGFFKSPTVAAIKCKGQRQAGKEVDSISASDKKMNKSPSDTTKNKDKFRIIKGMKVFLDLKNYPETGKIESHLRRFGVVVEHFLSKDIDWLIFNRDVSSVTEKSPPPSLLTPKGRCLC